AGGEGDGEQNQGQGSRAGHGSSFNGKRTQKARISGGGVGVGCLMPNAPGLLGQSDSASGSRAPAKSLHVRSSPAANGKFMRSPRAAARLQCGPSCFPSVWRWRRRRGAAQTGGPVGKEPL